MFRRLTFAAFLLAVLCRVVSGQVPNGRVELSIAGSFQVFVDEGEAQYLINIPVRAGFLATREFELESEIALTVPEDGQVGFIISGLLSYNLDIPGIRPFALVGYGFTNSYPIITNNVVSGSDGLTLGVLNLGVGVKVPMASKTALRAEYRFQYFNGQQDFGPLKIDVDFQVHSIFAGLSIFVL